MEFRAAPIVLAFKLGPKLLVFAGALLKSFKGVKGGLAAASFASYAWLFSWEFAVLIVGSLVIHEWGHVRAMKAAGIPTKGFYLIPFVGGAAVPERAFNSRMEEQFVALAGPMYGLGQALILYAVFTATGHPLAAVAAAWVSLLNLLNLLPISPLDGGRIMKSIAFSINTGLGTIAFVVGALLGLAVMVQLELWLLGIILIVAAIEFGLDKVSGKVEMMPGMTVLETLRCTAGYALTCIGLLAIIYGCGSVPEAAGVLSILR